MFKSTSKQNKERTTYSNHIGAYKKKAKEKILWIQKCIVAASDDTKAMLGITLTDTSIAMAANEHLSPAMRSTDIHWLILPLQDLHCHSLSWPPSAVPCTIAYGSVSCQHDQTMIACLTADTLSSKSKKSASYKKKKREWTDYEVQCLNGMSE